MEKEQPLIRISVRNLVEFILRSGDIDNRIAAADKDAMLLGERFTVRSNAEWELITMRR